MGMVEVLGAKSLQLHLTLWDPMDSSPPGSSVHGILQPRILEWVAISPSNPCLLCLLHWQAGSLWIVPPGKPEKWNQSSSVQLLNHVWLFATSWSAACQASLSITNSQSLLNLCPLSRWCHPTISSSVIPFFSHHQSFQISGSFQMSQFFTSGGQSTGVSALASVLPMNIQDWFPLEWTAWSSLQCKRLSRIFSNTTVQKH